MSINITFNGVLIMNVVLLGLPNVGKSAVLNRLTGSNYIISNYPGTSIEILNTEFKIGNHSITLFDTPGIYSIFSDRDEAQMIRQFLLDNQIDLIIQVMDAADLERNLVLSYELKDLGYPLLLLLNQIDRVRMAGQAIDSRRLSRILEVPVLPFSANSGEGVTELLDVLGNQNFFCRVEAGGKKSQRVYLERAFVCSGDCSQCWSDQGVCPAASDDLIRAHRAQEAAVAVSQQLHPARQRWLDKAERWIDQPVLGTLLLLGIAYLGFVILLQFINWSEGPLTVALEPVGMTIESWLMSVLPDNYVGLVLAKAIPEGLVIPFTIIMPAMLMVSFLMAILEDTGLLPRYSVALERFGRLFGISGQAIIPLSLGFGCRTPAVLATRIMPNEAQRFITVTLLSIVIPCAATVGIMAMVISAFGASLLVLVTTMLVTMLVLGSILSRLMPMEHEFIYELPPLRVPLGSNVWDKIKIRFSGFFTEVLPLLLVMSIIIRALMESGFFALFHGMESFTRTLFGIPSEAFVAVLITVFQRYLAPLVLLNIPLTPREATIAICMIALSLPCLPVMVMIIRELNAKRLFQILGLGFATSFTVGVVLNILLPV